MRSEHEKAVISELNRWEHDLEIEAEKVADEFPDIIEASIASRHFKLGARFGREYLLKELIKQFEGLK